MELVQTSMKNRIWHNLTPFDSWLVLTIFDFPFRFRLHLSFHLQGTCGATRCWNTSGSPGQLVVLPFADHFWVHIRILIILFNSGMLSSSSELCLRSDLSVLLAVWHAWMVWRSAVEANGQQRRCCVAQAAWNELTIGTNHVQHYTQVRGQTLSSKEEMARDSISKPKQGFLGFVPHVFNFDAFRPRAVWWAPLHLWCLSLEPLRPAGCFAFIEMMWSY